MKAFSKRGKVLWRVGLAVILWSILRERNNRAFNNSIEPAYRVYQ